MFSEDFWRSTAGHLYGKSSSVIPLVFAVFMMCAGCSVKEDRGLCPCSLVLDFKDVVEGGAVRVNVMADDYFHSEDVDLSQTDSLVLPIPRDKAFIANVIGGEKRGFVDFEGLRIAHGEGSPECRAFFSEFFSRGELMRLPVVLYKNYCLLTVSFIGPQYPYPFDVFVKGNVCGWNAAGRPLKGQFSCRLDQDSSGSGVVSLPRQEDDSLILEISEGEKLLRSFALGKYIAETGYDWSADELENVEVVIDYAKSEVVIKVADWNKIFNFDIVI